jgi:hypothetical protein
MEFHLVLHKEALKTVYSNKKYLVLSIAIFAILLISISMVSEFIFLSPFFVFHVPEYAIFDFVLIIIIASLSGIVTSLSIYRIRLKGDKVRKSGTGFFGSILGASTGVCGCGSFGFAAVSVFGAFGGTVTAFITNYETPLRLVSITILFYTYYASVKDITTKCGIVK